MLLSNPLRCDLRSHQHHLYIRLYADLLHAFSREAHTMHGCLIPPWMPLYQPLRLNPGKILNSHHPVSHRSVLQFLSVSKLRILTSPELRLLSQPSRLLQVAARTVCCLVPLRLMPAVDGTLWKWSRLWNQATLAWVLALLQARLSLSVGLSTHPREGFPCLHFFLIHKYSSCA